MRRSRPPIERRPEEASVHPPSGGTEVGVVRTVLGYDLEIQLAEIEDSVEADSTEALVSEASARDGQPARRQGVGRCLPDHGVEADALGSEFADIKGLTSRKESGVGIASRQVHIAIGRAQEGG